MGNGRFCKSCGSKLDEDSQFCTECGQIVDKDNKEQMTKRGTTVRESGELYSLLF